MDVEEKSSLFSLSIDDTTQSHLLSIAKWHKFIAIAGIVGCSLTVLILAGVNIYSLNVLASNNYAYDIGERIGELLGSLIFIAAFFTPCIFQVKFANKMLKGLAGNDQYMINQALRQLKIFSRYWGILVILLLVFFFVILAFGVSDIIR